MFSLSVCVHVCLPGFPLYVCQCVRSVYLSVFALCAGGLESESEYKYRGVDEKCRFNRTEVVVKISGGLNISSDENGLFSL